MQQQITWADMSLHLPLNCLEQNNRNFDITAVPFVLEAVGHDRKLHTIQPGKYLCRSSGTSSRMHPSTRQMSRGSYHLEKKQPK